MWLRIFPREEQYDAMLFYWVIPIKSGNPLASENWPMYSRDSLIKTRVYTQYKCCKQMILSVIKQPLIQSTQNAKNSGQATNVIYSPLTLFLQYITQ